MTQELTATLIVRTFSSECSHCRKPTLPRAERHTDISGWQRWPGGGCGARFTAIRAGYPGVSAERLHQMRPDLPVADTSPAA